MGETGPTSENDIAIVGVAVHLPGAGNAEEYWQNLRDGVESVRALSDEELIGAGVPVDQMRRPGYVRSASVLDGVYDFDAEFFGFSPKEAGIMDPQHRHFLTAAWEALEDAGHVPEQFDGAIGVFAGCGVNSYYMLNLLSNPDLVRDVGLFLLRHTGNDKDFLATRASYLFDLRGPSVNVQTACSTSLVASHLAVQHLLSGEVDLALAGGVTIEIPHGHGYQYHEGEILSPDGHCRAFDHRAQGTVFGSGVGVVALRRLDDALADGDQVYAVIKGTAVNNDGTQKVGYLAPSVDGQAACIAEAFGVADVDSSTIRYVECHGTGTPMGDPIEVAALTQAFRAGDSARRIDSTADANGWCGIGSVKTNIGHLDTAAGTASLIKVALALRNGQIPPSLNFEANNPLLELEQSPFFVNHRLSHWPRDGAHPRRAGVNSLGVGGTNAFAVVEEAPDRSRRPAVDQWRLLMVSARNRGALDDASTRLGEHLRSHPDLDLADVAWTLKAGRRQFAERQVVVVGDRAEAVELLKSRDARRVFAHTAGSEEGHLAFMFPGGGSQHLGMAAVLHRAEPVFAQHLDAGFHLMEKDHGATVRKFLLETEFADRAASESTFELMANQLPAIFLVEYAMAQLLISWGVTFDALVGHSVGENTAACVAGTMSFPDCLGLVTLRGQLMDRVAGGAVAVPLPPDEIAPLVDEFDLDLAVVNAPDLCVVSGATVTLAAFEARLRSIGTEPQRVRLNVGAHSKVLDPVLPEFRAYLESITLSPPTVPWVSNRSGTWITSAAACDPEYWVDHLRHTVNFSDCVATLAEEPGRVLLEVGPGKMLSSLARMNAATKSTQPAIPTMRHPDEVIDDEALLLTALGRLWAAGWSMSDEVVTRLFGGDDRSPRRVGLPTYPFQTQPFFIAPGAVRDTSAPLTTYVDRHPDIDEWFWEPVWKSNDADEPVGGPLSWLVLVDEGQPHGPGVGAELVSRLRARGDDVVVVRTGDSFQAVSDEEYVIGPENGLGDYESLMKDVVRTGRTPDRIIHVALLATNDRHFRPGSSFFHRNQELGFQSLVFLAQAWAGAEMTRPLHLVVATMCAQRVVPSDLVQWPEQATVLGPALVIPRELSDVTVTAVDIDQRDLFPESRLTSRLDALVDTVGEVRSSGLTGALRHGNDNGRAVAMSSVRPGRRKLLLDAIHREVLSPAGSQVVALRRDHRYVRGFRRVGLDEPSRRTATGPRLRTGGTVLVTGGLGGIALTIAEELVDVSAARLALVARTPLPNRSSWDEVTNRLGPDHPTSRRIAGVARLEAKGAQVLVLHGDVTDVAQMRTIAAAVRERFGSIDGVIHAAGTVDDGLIVTKSADDMDDVLAPKVYGTLVLDEVTEGDELDLFVVFSSTSTVSSPIGQVDYVAANTFLNQWVESRRAIGRDEVVAVNWGVWNEVGMAAAAAGRMLPSGTGDATAALETRPSGHPFFHTTSIDQRGVVRLSSRWSTDSEWFLDDHRTAAGDALLPGAGYVELLRAGLAEIGIDRAFEIHELTFLRPLAAPDGHHIDVQTVLSPTEAGYDAEVREAALVDARTAEDGDGIGRRGWRQVARASLELHEVTRPTDLDLQAVERHAVHREPTATHQQDHLRFGPRWDVVERVQTDGHQSIAWLQLSDEFTGDLDTIALHPALVDLGTGFAMNLIDGYTGDQLWVPVSYRSIGIHDRLPQRVIAVARARPNSTESRGFARFDVDLCDITGRVLVTVEEFTIKRLDGALDVGVGRPALASEVEFDQPVMNDRQLSQSEVVFQHNLAQGIVPDEGRLAFARALASGLPVVYVSSMDLLALRSQADAAAASQTESGSSESSAIFGRPNLDADFVAPRNDLEERLVAIWQELLGISEVGVQDNFFDLGGHSLIAVRLFARVKKVFSVEFPISVLFDAPTVEAVAVLVAEALPADATTADSATQTGDQSAAPSIIRASRPRYTHLVAMHPGEGGPRSPFFMMAGMFGNVLNLRHLAHLVGSDRPFYGVQARGLYGGAEPHEDFVQMAADYLAEVRLVQPNGPYLLGGFSGGGLAAYEMAQQLLAAGEEVSALVLLDTPLAFNPPLTLTDRLKVQRDNLGGQGFGYFKEWAVNRVRWEREKRHRLLNGPDAPTAEGALHSTIIESAFYRALAAYDTKPYDGVITLYRPKLTPLHVFSPDRQINIDRRFIYHDNGWGPFAQRVDVTEVPGTHDSMVLEPNVRVLAAHLRRALDRTEELPARVR